MSLMPTITHPYSPATELTAGNKINTIQKQEPIEIQSLEDRTSSFARVVLSENGITRVLEGKEAEEYTMAVMADVMASILFFGAIGCLLADSSMLTYFEDQSKLRDVSLAPSDRVEELSDDSLEASKSPVAASAIKV